MIYLIGNTVPDALDDCTQSAHCCTEQRDREQGDSNRERLERSQRFNGVELFANHWPHPHVICAHCGCYSYHNMRIVHCGLHHSQCAILIVNFTLDRKLFVGRSSHSVLHVLHVLHVGPTVQCAPHMEQGNVPWTVPWTNLVIILDLEKLVARDERPSNGTPSPCSHGRRAFYVHSINKSSIYFVRACVCAASE